MGFILTDSDSELGYELFKKGFDWDKWTRQRTETNKDHIAWLEESIAEYKRDLEEYDKTGKVERMDEPGVAWPWMEQGRDYFLENISSYEDSLAKAEDLPTKLKACWKGILQRIRSEAERQRAEGKKPRILFVDEQVYGAGTLRLIEAACREVKRLIPDLKAEYFTFMDSRVDVDEGQERGFRRSLGKRYLAVPTPRAYEGFRFREHGDKEPVIGVTKTLGEPTVRRSAVRDAEKMAYLRNLLRQIGEEFVESLGT